MTQFVQGMPLLGPNPWDLDFAPASSALPFPNSAPPPAPEPAPVLRGSVADPLAELGLRGSQPPGRPAPAPTPAPAAKPPVTGSGDWLGGLILDALGVQKQSLPETTPKDPQGGTIVTRALEDFVFTPAYVGSVESLKDFTQTSFSIWKDLKQYDETYGPREVPELAQPTTVAELASNPKLAGQKMMTSAFRYAPAAAGAIGGALAVGPEAAAGAGALGMAELLGMTGGASMATLGQVWGVNLDTAQKKYPTDPKRAYDEAVRATAVDTGFAGFSTLALGANPFGHALKDMALQTFITQPGIGVVASKAHQAETGENAGLSLADEYLNVTGPSVLMAGAGAVVPKMHGILTPEAAAEPWSLPWKKNGEAFEIDPEIAAAIPDDQPAPGEPHPAEAFGSALQREAAQRGGVFDGLGLAPERTRTPDSERNVVHLTDEERERRAGFIEHVTAAIKEIAPTVETQAVASLHGGRAVGRVISADNLKRIIQFATEERGPGGITADRGFDQGADTGRHEGLHALRELGLFKDDEWHALETEAKDKGWAEKHRIGEKYADKSPEVQTEEAITHEYQKGRKSRWANYPDLVRKLFLRIEAALARVQMAVRRSFGKNPTAEQVFRLVDGGWVGRRAPTSDPTIFRLTQEMRDPRVQAQRDTAMEERTGDEELAKRAAEHFGVTDDPREAGYILPNGKMLDLSGRHYAGEYENVDGRRRPAGGGRDYLSGQRSVDHRELADLTEGDGTAGMHDFMAKSGAVRFDHNGAVQAVGIPSDAQLRQIVRALKDAGSDGAQIESISPDGTVRGSIDLRRVTVANLKRFFESPEGNMGGVKFQRGHNGPPADDFYYKTERLLPTIAERAPAAQFEATLRNKGVKAEELEDLGIAKFLKEAAAKNETVTREQIQTLIETNRAEFEPYTYGDDPSLARREDAIFDELDDLEGKHDDASRNRREELNRMADALRRERHEGEAAKYETFTMPGGENYREHVLRLGRFDQEGEARWLRLRREAEEADKRSRRFAQEAIYAQDAAQRARLMAQSEAADAQFKAAHKEAQDLRKKMSRYRTSHWDLDNPIGHLRLKDRELADGGDSLHMEEGQSDWHNAGKKSGYRDLTQADLFEAERGVKEGLNEYRQVRDKAIAMTKSLKEYEANVLGRAKSVWRITDRDDMTKVLWEGPETTPHADVLRKARELGQGPQQAERLLRVDPAEKQNLRELREEVAAYNRDVVDPAMDRYQALLKQHESMKSRYEFGTPDAPFKKSISELLFKKLVRHAIDNGYDRVTWNTGEQVAESQGLNRQLSSIEYGTNDGKTWMVEATSLDGYPLTDISGQRFTAADLERYLGKDVADRIVNHKGAGVEEDRGYRTAGVLTGEDLKISPAGKRTTYDKVFVNAAKAFEKMGGKYRKVAVDTGEGKIAEVHALEITPEMKAKVLGEGLPYYQRGETDGPYRRRKIGKVSLTPEQLKTHGRLLREITDTIKTMAPHVKVLPVQNLVERGGGWKAKHTGAFFPETAVGPLIVFALDGPNGFNTAVAGTARHEVVHALRRAGIINGKEWQILVDAATAGGWKAKHRIDDRYSEFEEDGRMEEAIAEEMGAGFGDDYALHSPLVRKVFQKLNTLMRRIKTGVQKVMGKDVRAQEIMEMIESGAMGWRRPGRDEGGDPAMQRGYHGTIYDFKQFRDPSDDYMIDRALGTHFAKDPRVASKFAEGLYEAPGGPPPEGGRVIMADIPDNYLDVDQKPYDWAQGRTDLPPWQGIETDQYAVERMAASTAFRQDPEMLARFIRDSRAVEMPRAKRMADELAAGGKVDVDGTGNKYDLDGFVRNFGGKPFSPADRRRLVEIARQHWQEQGFDGLRYKNTSPREMADAEDPTAYIVFDPKQIKSAHNEGTWRTDTADIYLQAAPAAAAASPASARTLPAHGAGVRDIDDESAGEGGPGAFGPGDKSDDALYDGRAQANDEWRRAQGLKLAGQASRERGIGPREGYESEMMAREPAPVSAEPADGAITMEDLLSVSGTVTPHIAPAKVSKREVSDALVAAGRRGADLSKLDPHMREIELRRRQIDYGARGIGRRADEGKRSAERQYKRDTKDLKEPPPFDTWVLDQLFPRAY